MSLVPKSLVVVSLAIAALSLGACEISAPFAGPGFQNGEVTVDAEGPYFIAATHLILPADDAESDTIFNERMDAISAVIDDQPGLIGYSFRTKIGGVDRYTVTVWESEEDAVAWVNHDVHVDAMSAMAGRAAGGLTTHWTIEAADLPPEWDAIKARLGTDGRDVY